MSAFSIHLPEKKNWLGQCLAPGEFPVPGQLDLHDGHSRLIGAALALEDVGVVQKQPSGRIKKGEHG